MDTIALTPATATIDAGRLLTLERRKRFADLKLIVSRPDEGAPVVVIDETTKPGSFGILDEGNIAAALRTVNPAAPAALVMFIEHDVRAAMRDWCNAGYPGECLPVKVYEAENVSISVI